MNTLELSVNQCEDFLTTGITSTLVSGQSVLKSGDLITVCDRQCVVQAVQDEPHSTMKRVWIRRVMGYESSTHRRESARNRRSTEESRMHSATLAQCGQRVS